MHEPCCYSIPVRTYSALNMRWHWAKKARVAHQQRWAARATTMRAFQRLLKPLEYPVTVEMVRVSSGKLDDDNLRGALKSVRDGICDGLGIPDDSDPRIGWTYDQAYGGRGVYAIRVTITPRKD